MNDKDILDLFRKRDQQAITETDRVYGKKLLGLSFKILNSAEDAQECVNDTYFKAWELIPPQYPRFFSAFLAKICRNFAFGRLDWNNAARRKAEIVNLSDELARCLPDDSQERSWESKELRGILNGFLSELDRESRQIFVRRYWYCDSISEISERYGISQSKVKTRLHRTREKLRLHLEKEGIQI